MFKKTILAAFAAVSLTGTAEAATLYFNNFDGYGYPGTTTVGTSVGGFKLLQGNLGVAGCAAGPSQPCLVIGDSTNAAAAETDVTFGFMAGESYTLSFMTRLIENGTTFTVTVGSYLSEFVATATSGQTHVFTFTPGTTGFATIGFSRGGGQPYFGPYFDDVSLTGPEFVTSEVPLPATLPLMALGLGGLLAARRRKS
ncbi:PEP-CTERM sorting domain-containing protein [Tropicibacter sp. S64]|uniref:PEP-CTERM sorting domain-containing protein n=1 Tax=Tropicibacter sp. S64 TaxID=3415122 RepID=UPI003C7CB4A7